MDFFACPRRYVNGNPIEENDYPPGETMNYKSCYRLNCYCPGVIRNKWVRHGGVTVRANTYRCCELSGNQFGLIDSQTGYGRDLMKIKMNIKKIRIYYDKIARFLFQIHAPLLVNKEKTCI